MELEFFGVGEAENGLKIPQKCSFMTKNLTGDQPIDFKTIGRPLRFHIFYSMKIRR